MGRLSDQRRSARRLGRQERARVKRHHRSSGGGFVGGAVAFEWKAGRKKWRKVCAYLNRLTRAHLVGESPTPNSVRVIKRPLYTVTLGPPVQGHDMEQKIFVPGNKA